MAVWPSIGDPGERKVFFNCGVGRGGRKYLKTQLSTICVHLSNSSSILFHLTTNTFTAQQSSSLRDQTIWHCFSLLQPHCHWKFP